MLHFGATVLDQLRCSNNFFKTKIQGLLPKFPLHPYCMTVSSYTNGNVRKMS